MKSTATMIILLVFTVLSVAINTTESAANELRPIQKIMQARSGWLKAMNDNLAGAKLTEVAKIAGELTMQTETVAKNLQGERKDLTLKVASLAKNTAEAAAKGDATAVKTKIGEIKGTCATCHDKYRN